jgi:thiosulfate dehydrogenase
MRVFLAFVLGLLIIPVTVYAWFSFGHPPVAAGDSPFPFEAQIVRQPLGARIEREAPKQSPLPLNDANLNAGGETYRTQCASCHGLKAHPSQFGTTMYPEATQLWEKHGHKGVVGVSDDPAGETFWKIKNGIRLTGMPSYQSLLSEDQMWQVSLLLSSADKPLPQAADDSVSKPIQ